jgi:protein-disulfide isomerase
MIYYRIALVLTALFAAFVAYSGYGVYESWSAKHAIFEAPPDQSFGPEDATLTIVEFMDYSCEHCRQINPALMQAVTEDGHVRLIVRPLPSKTPEGSQFARMAYAGAELGKFREMHEFIIANFTAPDDGFIKTLAETLKTDEAALEAAYAKPESDEAVWKNLRLFTALGGQVTPTFFIGPDKIFIPYEGMPKAEDFKTMFDDARKGHNK